MSQTKTLIDTKPPHYTRVSQSDAVTRVQTSALPALCSLVNNLCNMSDHQTGPQQQEWHEELELGTERMEIYNFSFTKPAFWDTSALTQRVNIYGDQRKPSILFIRMMIIHMIDSTSLLYIFDTICSLHAANFRLTSFVKFLVELTKRKVKSIGSV